MYEAVRQASEAGNYFMGILNTPLAGWFVSSLILLAYFAERMRVRVLDEYLEQKFSELDNQRLQMEKQIEMRERRIQMQIQMRAKA
jgi:beta-lactamase regulating signal transducer with metallopeptidase domain